MDWRELQEEVKKRQTGELPSDVAIDWDDPEAVALFKANRHAQMGLSPTPFDYSAYRDLQHSIQSFEQDNPIDLNALAAAVGYGQNRRDYRSDIEDFAENPQDYRANAQSQANKVINGAIKAIPTALTTYADDTVGLLASLYGYTPFARMLGQSVFDGGKNFVSSSFGEKMQQIRDKMEEIFPNYRTQQEEEDKDQWWKHLNGNFFGDVFLKNLGFTLGAGYAGKTYANLFRGSQGKLVNEAYKAAVTAASKGESEIEAFRRILQGAAMENPQKVYKQLSNISKTFNRLGWQSQVVGAFGGAVGEARTEALSGAKEFRDEQFADIANKYQEDERQVMNELASNKNFWEKRPVYDGFGNIVDEEYVLNADGQSYKDARLAEIRDDMNDAKSIAEREAERLANHIFGMNVPLLAASNAVMFGRMFAGGFRTQSNARFRGKAGALKGVGSQARAIGAGVNAILTEGFEELNQKVISEGEKDISKKNMSAFYDGKYDTDAIKDVSEWLLSMTNSAKEVYGQGSSWEEFAVGALTGGMGHVANFSRTAEGGIKWDPQGGFYGAYRAGIQARDENRALAEKLNERYNDPDFKNLWSSMVRHKKYDKIMDEALATNQQFVWKTAEEKQLVSDVMMFADAGRLNDLEGYVDAFSRLTPDEVHDFRDMFVDETDPEFTNKTDKELTEWIKERAQEVKDTIQQYRDFHDSIDFLSLGTSDKDVIDELIFTASQLENFEKRYQKLANEVWEKIRPTVEAVARKKNNKGEPTKRAKEAQAILDSANDTLRIFGGEAIDIADRGISGRNIGSIMSKLTDDAVQQQRLEVLDKWGAFSKDPTLKQQVQDLQKLVRARQNYYAKLVDPTFRQKFEEQKKEPVQVAETIQEDGDKKKAEENVNKLKQAKTLKEYINNWLSLDPSTPEVAKHEDQLISADKTISAFDKQREDADNFVGTLGKAVDKAVESSKPEDAPLWDFIAEQLTQLDSNQSILSAPDGQDPIVSVAQDFLNSVSSNPEAENEVRKILQNVLKDVATANKLGVVAKPAAPAPAPTPVEVPTPPSQPEPGNDDSANEYDDQGGTNEDEEDDGGAGDVDLQAASAEELAKAFSDLEKINYSDSPELNKIISGDFSSYPNLNEQDKLLLYGEAVRMYKELLEKEGKLAGNTQGSSDIDERTQKSRDAMMAKRREVSVDASPFPIEEWKEAKNSGKRIFALPERSDSNTKRETSDWLRNHKVQAFLNSGALADIAYAFRKAGKELPIYYIANPHYVDNNYVENPFVVNGGKATKQNEFGLIMRSVLLAVDMNEIVPGTDRTIREYLSAYENASVFSDSTLISVTEGEDVHKYQVIGEILSDPSKDINQNLMWEHAVRRSIFPQYYSDIHNLGGSGNMAKSGKWYVAKIHPEVDTEQTDTHEPDWTTGKKIYTTLNYIGTGRKETTAPNESKPVKKSLASALSEYRALGRPYHWAIITNEEPLYSPGAPAFPLGSINAGAGSLWIATQNADNSWTWEKVTVSLMNETGVDGVFDFSSPNKSSLTQTIEHALDIILRESDPTMSDMEQKQDFDERLQQIRLLDDIIYLGAGNTFHLVFEQQGDRTVADLMVGGAHCYTKEDVADALRDAKYRFQVTQDTISKPDAMDELIDAGVLSADMNSFIPIAANIGVNPLSDTDADNNKVEVHVLQSADSFTVQPSNNVSFGRGRHAGAVWFGNVGYRRNGDGTVTKIGDTEPTISRTIQASVEVGSELLELDEAGMLDAFSGDRWIVDDNNIQYTEMYEKDVDGIKVRVVRRGRNGTFLFEYNTDEWDALMQVAEKQERSDDSRYEEVVPEETDADIYAAYNKAKAEEEGGSTVPEEPKKQGRRRRPATTVEEQEQSDDREDITQECGEIPI